MTFSDFRKVLASTLASCAVLGMALSPVAEPGRTRAQDAPNPTVVRRAMPPARDRAPAREDARITMNFKDQDIGQVAEAVAMVTHKTFIVDSRVRAQVTMLSSTPVTPSEMYEIFLSILAVHGAIAVPGAGGTIKIMLDANQRFYPGSHDVQDQVSSTSDEVVTEVIPLKNISAVQMQTVLRPVRAPGRQYQRQQPVQHAHRFRSRLQRGPDQEDHRAPRCDQRCGRGSDADAECLGPPRWCGC